MTGGIGGSAAESASAWRWRVNGVTVTLLSLIVIVVATLTPGEPLPAPLTRPLTCLVCGWQGMLDVWHNVVLFVPLGVGLAMMGVRWQRALLAALLLSLSIETLQFTVVAGRFSSLSDVVTNTSGAVLGALATRHWRWWLRPGRHTARRLAVAAVLVDVLALTLTALGLRWSDGPRPYRVNQLPPASSTLRAFEGTIETASLDGLQVTPGWRLDTVMPASDSDTLRVAAIVSPSYPPGMLRPLVWLLAPDWSEVLVFGQRRRALVLRLRTASANARFASPTYVLDDAFPPGAEHVTVAAEVTRTTVRLRAATPAWERTRTYARSIDSGWQLLVVPSLSLAGLLQPLSVLWLIALACPAGYWARRAAGRTRRSRLAAIAGVAVPLLVAAPLIAVAFRLSLPSPALWLSPIAGVAGGWALDRVAGTLARSRSTPRPAPPILPRPRPINPSGTGSA